MIRTLKLLGLMAVAALAMSAFAASAANAEPGEPGEFTAGLTNPLEHTETELVGTQEGTSEDNFLKALGDDVTCENAHYTGTAAGTAKEVTLTPKEYTGCKSGGGLPATVTHNKCGFLFHQPTTISGEYPYTGLVDIECEAGKVIEVHIYSGAAHGFTVCTLTVPAQKNLSHVVYRNVANEEGDHITAWATVEKQITVHREGLCGNGSTAEGSFETTVTLEGYKPNTETKVKHDIWLSDETTP